MELSPPQVTSSVSPQAAAAVSASGPGSARKAAQTASGTLSLKPPGRLTAEQPASRSSASTHRPARECS